MRWGRKPNFTGNGPPELAVPGQSASLAGNTTWILAGELIGKAASFVFVVIVARGLGTTQYGYFTFATAFVPLFLAFGTWGIEMVLVREMSRNR